VGCAKAVKADEEARRKSGKLPQSVLEEVGNTLPDDLLYGSVVVAKKPGDGSAREQAASCQRVLGGVANIALEYATKRYRSNLINWGMLPLICREFAFGLGDYVLIENVVELIKADAPALPAKLISNGKVKNITLEIGSLTRDEKAILLSGCLINFNKQKAGL
jgi:aconitate hydratase